MADMTIFPTGLTYSRNTKAPLESNRLFDTLALAQAYVDNADQNAYVGLTISVTKDEVASNNGLYYIERIADADNETGLLVKVGSDSAADITNLTTNVTEIKNILGDSTSGLVADVAKNTSDIAANVTAISKKADSFDVEKGLSYVDNKIGVVVSTTEGNSLTIDENGLYVAVPEINIPEYSLTSIESPADGYASQYEFKKDGVVLNTINIPKDQFLKSATYDDVNNKLVFVFNTANGESTNEVDVNDLVDTYTAGDYITITDAVIAVDYESLKAKINTDLVAPAIATVTAIDSRLQTAESKIGVLESASSDYAARIGVLETAKGDHESRIATLEGVQHPTLAQVTTLEANYETLNTNVTNISNTVENINVKDVDSTASNGVSLKLDTAGKIGVSVDLEYIANEVISKHEIPAPDASDIKLEATEGSSFVQDTTVQAAIINLDQRIENAVAGGMTGVNAGNGISVTGSASNPTVSVKVIDGSALRSTTDGLSLEWEEI